jgi:hypothetical protein
MIAPMNASHIDADAARRAEGQFTERILCIMPVDHLAERSCAGLDLDCLFRFRDIRQGLLMPGRRLAAGARTTRRGSSPRPRTQSAVQGVVA